MQSSTEILSAFFLSDDPRTVLEAARALPGLSCGEVKKPERLNSRTEKPERDGLLCAKIFGPVEDYRCNCGFLSSAASAGQSCPKCGVLCGESSLRAERWGHISAPLPLIHPTLLPVAAGRLGCSEKELGLVARFTANLNADGSVKRGRRSPGGFWEFSDDEPYARGAAYLHAQLEARGAEELMVMAVPVTPPASRASRRDAQDGAYGRLVNRRNRLARLIELDAPLIILENEERMTQGSFERAYAVIRTELQARRSRPSIAQGTRGAELLQAVLDHPDDDSFRAVYGDWLMEENDPRGEFIALQLANAGKPRMSRQEGELLSRHYDEWVAPLGGVIAFGVFRRGFLSSCMAIGPRVAPFVGHSTWATVEHVNTDLPELIGHEVMRSLKRVSTTFRCLSVLCKGARHLPRITAAMVRMTSCPPRGWREVLDATTLPGLRELTLLHQSAAGGEDWGWLLETPLLPRLESLTLGMSLERLGQVSLATWLAVLEARPRLQRLSLSFGKKRLIFELRRAPTGVELRLTTTRSLLELTMLMQEETITADIVRALAGISRDRVTLLPVDTTGWFGEGLHRLAKQLREQLGDSTTVPDVPA